MIRRNCTSEISIYAIKIEKKKEHSPTLSRQISTHCQCHARKGRIGERGRDRISGMHVLLDMSDRYVNSVCGVCKSIERNATLRGRGGGWVERG